MSEVPGAEPIPVKGPAPEWDEPQRATPSAPEPPVPTLEAPHAVVDEPVPQTAGTGWYYCLFESHPGVPPFSSQPLDVGRLFEDAKDAKVPTCPADGEQNNIPAEGPDMPPAAITKLASRFQTG